MAKKNTYALHEDFQKLPVFTFRFNRPLMGLVNAFFRWERKRNAGSPHPQVSRRIEKVQRPDGSSFDVIVMRPQGASEPMPALIYYHGGAFALTYASMHLQFCERYAAEAGCCAIVVDYRLAPSQPFPAGFDDCYQSLEWARERAPELGIDTDRIAVGGDSAGGAMAAGVSQKALDDSIPVRAQLLIYPVLDSDCKSGSATAFEDTPIWNAGSNRRMWDMYLKRVERAKPPVYASPGRRDDLAGLPAAYVETAEFDPLRDEGMDYVRRLEAQGVKVWANPTSGTIHGYELAPKNPETIRSLEARVEFLRGVFDA